MRLRLPGDEALVQAEFGSACRSRRRGSSRRRPGEPGRRASASPTAVLPRSDEPYKAGLPTRTSRSALLRRSAAGAVLASRCLGAVTLRFRVNGGRAERADDGVARGRALRPGRPLLPPMTGTVTGTRRATRSKVWFEGGGATSVVHLPARSDGEPGARGRGRGLHGRRARADARAALPAVLPGRAAGERHRRRRLRRRRAGSTAPDPLGVLGHYDAVVWYTGDDLVTREPGWARTPTGWRWTRSSRSARTSTRRAGAVHGQGGRGAVRDRPGRPALRPDHGERAAQQSTRRSGRGALRWSGSGDSQGGPDPSTVRRSPSRRTAEPWDPNHRRSVRRRRHRRPRWAGLMYGFNCADSAQNQADRLLVHRDRRLPQGHRPGGQLPAVRELGRRPST